LIKLLKNKIFSIIYLILSILILSYVYYKSEIVFGGNRINIYIQYYIVSIILIIISSITFFFKKDLNRKFLLVISSTLITLYLIEGLLQGFSIYNQSQHFKKFKKKYKNINIDTRSKLEVYKEEKTSENLSLVFNHKIYFDENTKLFILGGKSNTKHLYCNEIGYYSYFYSDRFGFRNIDKIWDNNNLDIVIVGDSFGLNACVNKENTIVEILRKKNKKFKILNLSWDGNGPLTNYAGFFEYIDDKNTKKLIWLFFPNDFENLNAEKNNRILKKYINKENFSQNLKLKQNNIDETIDNLINENFLKKSEKKRESIKLSAFIKLQKLRSFVSYKGKIEYDHNLLKDIFQKTKNLTEKKNIEMIVVYLPDFWEIKNNKKSEKQKFLFSILNELDLKYLNFFEIISEIKNPLSVFPFESYGHYNEKGYELLANFIYESLY
tara:strand:+ start:2054 stop:3364 length:1311 start_codon:yes stop_codon:yes gene_type:complete